MQFFSLLKQRLTLLSTVCSKCEKALVPEKATKIDKLGLLSA